MNIINMYFTLALIQQTLFSKNNFMVYYRYNGTAKHIIYAMEILGL